MSNPVGNSRPLDESYLRLVRHCECLLLIPPTMAISGSEKKIRRDVGETNSELVVLKQLCVQSVDALKTNSELVVLKQLCVQSVEVS